ncbi:hypothetical protein Tco_0294684 [Tanacetum coccineum]
MASLEYKDDHNKVVFLEKAKGSENYYQILDFLNGSHLRYALTHCPHITFDSLVKQFWTSAMVRTLEGRPQDIVATIDGNEVVVTESSIRTQLKLNDEGGLYAFTLQEILEGIRAIGYPTDGVGINFQAHWQLVLFVCLLGGLIIFPGIQTDDTTPKAIGRFSSKMFANMKLKFVGEPMPLLAAMLPGGPVDGGAANVAGGNPLPPPPPANLGVDAAANATAVLQPTSPLVEPHPVSTSSPVRQPTPSHVKDLSPRPLSPRPSPTNPFPFMEDDFSGGDSYVSPTRSNDALPTTGQSAGSAEEPDTLIIMSTKLDRCMEKVGVLESELNNTKKTLGSAVLKLVARVKKLEGKVRKTKRRVIISDSEDEEASTKTDFDLEALSELVNATLGSASQIEVEAAVTLSQASRDAQLRSDGTPERSYQRKDLRRRLRKQSNIPAFEKFQAQVAAVDVSSSDKGKAPVVDETSKADLLSAQERALKNLHDAMLGEELARKVQAEEEANLARHREELAKKAQADPEGSFAQGSSLPVQRQREIDAASLLYTDAEWFHIMTQIATHTELSRQLLGDDVTEETFSERLADLLRRKR